MIVLLQLFLLLAASSAWGALPEYQIAAAYSESDHQIYGSEKITFTNESAAPLFDLYLFLYPNLYLEPDPDVDSNFYQQAYPVGFNPGGMRITAVQDLQGTPLSFYPEAFKKKTLARVRLPAPIAPGESFEFIVHFLTVIPEKYGVFGRYRTLVTLQGGWRPYLASFEHGMWSFIRPPSPSRLRISFTLPANLDLIGSVPPKEKARIGSRQTFFFEAEGLSHFSLSIGARQVRIEKKIGPVALTYHFKSKDGAYAKEALKTIVEATSFFLKESGPIPRTEIGLTESYLYQDLATPGEKILYLSAKLFKTFPLLKRFHNMRIARGIFVLLWREKLPGEEPWVIEGMADLETKQFFRSKYGPGTLEAWLEPFGFIPVVDEILYSKALPLRQVYFSESVSPLIEEDLTSFNTFQAEGTLFNKLRILLGEARVTEGVALYLKEIGAGTPRSFRKVLGEVSGMDLDLLLDQWLSTNPAVDFGIGKIEARKIEGGYLTSILVQKTGTGTQPVEILAEEENGSRISIVWSGEGRFHEEALFTPSPIEVVELDPHHLSDDPNQLNNRYPQLWKMVVTDFPVPSYNVNTHSLSYSAELLLQRVFDSQNGIALDYAHSDTGDSGGVSLSHIVRPNHTIILGVNYLRPDPPIGSPAPTPAGTVHLGYVLNYPHLPLTSYLQGLTGRYPRSNITFGYDQRFTGGIYETLFSGGVDLRRSYLLSNYREVAGRFFWGESFGSLFRKSRFFLGGEEAMRGFLPLRFEGNNMTLASGEYRFPLYYETDVNFLGLVLSHTLQEVFFADAGNVADYQTLFSFKNYKFDAGTGIRWNVDAFGLYPVIFRFDVALPIASPVKAESRPHYYIGAGQIF